MNKMDGRFFDCAIFFIILYHFFPYMRSFIHNFQAVRLFFRFFYYLITSFLDNVVSELG